MKDYSCELGAACGPEAAAGRELAAVWKRRCVAEEAQVAGEGDELLLLLFVRAVVRDDAHLFGYELTAPAAAPRERARNWKPDTA